MIFVKCEARECSRCRSGLCHEGKIVDKFKEVERAFDFRIVNPHNDIMEVSKRDLHCLIRYPKQLQERLFASTVSRDCGTKCLR